MYTEQTEIKCRAARERPTQRLPSRPKKVHSGIPCSALPFEDLKSEMSGSGNRRLSFSTVSLGHRSYDPEMQAAVQNGNIGCVVVELYG